MTVALRPQFFAGGEAAEDGTGWEIGGVVYDRNPKKLVTGPWRDFVSTWIAWRGNGMAPGFLPDVGGWEDQGAVLTDAFRIADKVYNELEESAPAKER